MSLTSADVSSSVRVDQNDRQVVVAVEDDRSNDAAIVLAYDSLVERQTLVGLVNENGNPVDVPVAISRDGAGRYVVEALVQD